MKRGIECDIDGVMEKSNGSMKRVWMCCEELNKENGELKCGIKRGRWDENDDREVYNKQSCVEEKGRWMEMVEMNSELIMKKDSLSMERVEDDSITDEESEEVVIITDEESKEKSEEKSDYQEKSEEKSDYQEESKEESEESDYQEESKEESEESDYEEDPKNLTIKKLVVKIGQ